MEDVKKKKKDWMKKLDDTKLKSLLQLRDSLMATASFYMMGVDDCKASSAEDVDLVTDLLLLFFVPYILDTVFKELQAELVAADGKIQALNPHLHLDTLEDRCEYNYDLPS